MSPQFGLVGERARELADDWELTPRRVVLALGAAAVAAAVVVVAFMALRPSGSRPAPELALPMATPLPTATPAPVDVVVHVAGAVSRPGVYTLPPGARVADALGAAGGNLDEADLDRVNLAAPLADGQRLYVPTFDEEVPAVVSGGADPAGPTTETTAAVDLNQASAEQLDTLPGVGPATAQAIIDARPFASVDELIQVRGIGPAKLDELRAHVVVG